jgi:predicted enzyme related to lactoylglutathione lyase
VVVDKMEVPGVGWLSLFEDPDGRVLGLWKQGEK